jgi:ferredoxin
VVGLIAGLSLAVFTGYDKLPEPRKPILGGAAVLLSLAAVALAGGGAAAGGAAVVASALLTALLTYDYSGSTPVEGGSHFAERTWHVRLDEAKCQGVYNCWAVCPEACFEKREAERLVELRHDDRCIRCGACIVQCPLDALAFEDGAGHRIEPDTIRRTKLNLMGQRSVEV